MFSRRQFIGSSAAATAVCLAGCSGKKEEISSDIDVTALLEDPERLKKGLMENARDVFSKNRVDSSIGLFHLPSSVTYRSFFAWDSGWHIVALAHVDPEAAYKELETVFTVQTPEGRVPHQVRVPELKPETIERKLTLYLLRRQFDDMGRTRFIDPPSFLIAAQVLFEKTGDERVLALLPKMEKCVDYLTGPRDLFGDGLVSIIHPWESGTDSAPVFDAPLGIENVGSPGAVLKYATTYPELLNFAAKKDFDLEELARANRFVFEDVGMNSVTCAGIVAISELYRLAGYPEKSKEYMSRAKAMAAAIETIMWDEKAGFFYPRYDIEKPKLSRRRCLTGLTPLITGLVSEDKAGRVLDENLLSPAHFYGPWLVPFNSISELEENIPMENTLLWRGHCIWANMNWMAARAADNYGRPDVAREITRSTASMVARSGFFEFYHTRTGKGGGAPLFTWPALVIDMIERYGI